ncbi:FAD-dependent oxidoreductase [Gemmata sp. SH-PL17]|uniref:FAD-dependent oxidoreductase n=1 Tax=Gemmata sp. SH-PL17 TaxID=1630693 RepID=UPI00194F14E0
MARKFRVGIVGFGIAGATTAYLLARDGHSVTLLAHEASGVNRVFSGRRSGYPFWPCALLSWSVQGWTSRSGS